MTKSKLIGQVACIAEPSIYKYGYINIPMTNYVAKKIKKYNHPLPNRAQEHSLPPPTPILHKSAHVKMSTNTFPPLRKGEANIIP